MISRRGLFSFAAGATAIPFVKPVHDGRWTAEEAAEEAKAWEARAEEELLKPHIVYLKAKVGRPGSRVVLLTLDDGTVLSMCQKDQPTPITLHSDIEVLAAKVDGETRVLNVYVDGKKLNMLHVSVSKRNVSANDPRGVAL